MEPEKFKGLDDNPVPDPEKVPKNENIEKNGRTEKQKESRRRAIMAVAGIALVAVGIGVGVKYSEHIKSSPVVTTTSIETIQPSQTATTESITTTTVTVEAIEAMPTVESLEVDDSLLSDPEALTEIWVNERTTEWFNAGATLDNAKAALDSSVSLVDYAKEVAKEYDRVFIDALLIKDWESNRVLTKWVDDMVLMHWQVLALYFSTAPAGHQTNPADKTPYMRGSEYTQIISSSTNAEDGSVIIVDVEHNYDNADLNRVGEDLTYDYYKEDFLNEKYEPTRTFSSVNGKIRLSDVAFKYASQ